MSTISTEDLFKVTQQTNARLEEFDADLPRIPKGVVRTIIDVYDEYLAEQMQPMTPVQKYAAELDVATAAYGYGFGRGQEKMKRELGIEEPPSPRQVTGSERPAGAAAELPPADFVAVPVAPPVVEASEDSPAAHDETNPATQWDNLGGDDDDDLADSIPTPLDGLQIDPPKSVEKLTWPENDPDNITRVGEKAAEVRAHISPAAAAALGPEHTLVTPLQTSRRGRPPANPGVGPEEVKAAAYELLRNLAKDGVMPRLADYEAARDKDLPAPGRLTQIVGKNWKEIAEELGLRYVTPQERATAGRLRLASENKAAGAVAADASAAGSAAQKATPRPQPSIPPIPEVQTIPARVVMAEPLTSDLGEGLRPRLAPQSLAAEMAAQRRQLRAEVMTFIKEIAVDGNMPSLEEYNTRKPETLPRAIEMMNRLGYQSWHDVAHDNVLKYRAPGKPIGAGRGQ